MLTSLANNSMIVGRNNLGESNLLGEALPEKLKEPLDRLPENTFQPTTLSPEEKYHRQENYTLQFVFIGYDDTILKEDELLAKLDPNMPVVGAEEDCHEV